MTEITDPKTGQVKLILSSTLSSARCSKLFIQTVEFDRIVTNEMFEHMKNYEKLFEKVSKWLKPKSGILFIHVFCHRNFPYQFKVKKFFNRFQKIFLS